MKIFRRLAIAAVGVTMLLAGLAAGGSPAQAAQPVFPIRAAFYYPWFPETWGNLSDPFTNYHPTLGYYDSSDTAVIQQHIAWMQQAGIQAGIASWWGKSTPTDGRVPLLEANAGTFKWTVYYEPEGTSDPSVTKIDNDLSYIRNHYVTNHPEWLRVNGKPVIFVYADATDGCGMADRWNTANAGRFYVVLKVFTGFASCANQPDSWHQYNPAIREDSQPPYSYTISPGFWKKGETTARLARNTTAFTTAAQNMVASNAHFELITTFNEWGEGTAIEPSTEWGQTYINILAGV